MLKKVLFYCLLLLSLTACARDSSPTDMPSLDATILFETAVSQTTIDFAMTQSLVPTHTMMPMSTKTPIPTLDRTRPPIQSPTAEKPCDQAAAGHPIDVTVPDGSVMAPGGSFSKTWRLENAGSCTWTRQYAVTFFSGNNLSAFQMNTLSQEVDPGQVIDVTVDMVAPQKEGIYQSNWMISNADGILFGIGPNGDAPFWARIEVVMSVTETPVFTPTVTNTPVVYVTGEAALENGTQLDLDSATLNPDDAARADFDYQYGGNPLHILTTMNGTRWMIFGETRPSFADCNEAGKTSNAISFNTVPVGTYLCYRTSGALPGRLLMEGFADGQLSISFLTWAVP